MEIKQKTSFQFRNAVSPIYIKSLFLPLQYGKWYTTPQLISILRSNGHNVKGSDIVSYNLTNWSLVGLGVLAKKSENLVGSKMFRLTKLGKQFIDTYSTNPDLFYDLIHFLFYSTYRSSQDIMKSSLWLYWSTCNILWMEAPAALDTSSLANRLQVECHEQFAEYDPSFSVRSVGSIFPWLQTLSPPFLSKEGNKSQLYSNRRSFCTPQLFHLATDLVYRVIEGVQYGTSLAINEQQIEDICKVCLLNPEKFWNMASLAEMTINGYEIHQGQWGTSILLEGPPGWITLPDFSKKQTEEDEDMFVDGGEE